MNFLMSLNFFESLALIVVFIGYGVTSFLIGARDKTVAVNRAIRELVERMDRNGTIDIINRAVDNVGNPTYTIAPSLRGLNIEPDSVPFVASLSSEEWEQIILAVKQARESSTEQGNQ